MTPVAGCVVDDEIMGSTAGYNDTVKEWIDENGSPTGSYRNFFRDLPTVWINRSPDGILNEAGEAIDSGDGRYVKWVVHTEYDSRVCAGTQNPKAPLQVGRCVSLYDGKRVEIIWPSEPDLIWLRIEDKRGNLNYVNIHCKDGLILQDVRTQPN